jgi:hypothetical protein
MNVVIKINDIIQDSFIGGKSVKFMQQDGITDSSLYIRRFLLNN